MARMIFWLYFLERYAPLKRKVMITAPCAIASRYVCRVVKPNALMIRLENAPRPPVGMPLVNEMSVTDHTTGSVRASRTWYHCRRRGLAG